MLNDTTTLRRVKKTFSPQGSIKSLLRQFGIAEKVLSVENFWYHYTRMELEWILYDAHQHFKEQMLKLHPDKPDGDAKRASLLASAWTEIQKRFNKRLHPPPLTVPPWFQIDDNGEPFYSTISRPTSKPQRIYSKTCAFSKCHKSFETTIDTQKFCCSRCSWKNQAQKHRDRHKITIKKTCKRPDCSKPFETGRPLQNYCCRKCSSIEKGRRFREKVKQNEKNLIPS
jgi:hypothetical protein